MGGGGRLRSRRPRINTQSYCKCSAEEEKTSFSHLFLGIPAEILSAMKKRPLLDIATISI